MKNITILYIVALCISIILPFIVFERFTNADKEFFFYYTITVITYTAAAISIILKEGYSRTFLLPFFSVFVFIFSGFHLVITILIVLLDVSYHLDRSNGFFILIALFQLGFCILAIKHIRPQKIENLEHKLDDPYEF
ncbi:MAG: hypothetical protein GQ574_18960 [Crocinitomix sp.]|nr:hypothetical protein [Crocinitomix sp.]